MGRTLCLLLPVFAAHATAQTPRPRTYANPIDIDYRYNFEQVNEGISYRSGADPVMVVHRGRYYLFEMLGDGYWRSSDLPILMLTQPATGRVEFYNRLLPWLPMARAREGDSLAKPDSVQPGPWDPQFFHDADTERWFLYWNSSNVPAARDRARQTRRHAYKGRPEMALRARA